MCKIPGTFQNYNISLTCNFKNEQQLLYFRKVNQDLQVFKGTQVFV